MSLSAFKQPIPDVESTQPPAHDVQSARIILNGHQLWLQWLQKLLTAGSLRLYACDYVNDGVTLAERASWPDTPASGPWLGSLAIRAARTRSVVQARHKDDAASSVTCIPSIAGSSHKLTRHVLVIERNTPARLDQRTQLNLVTWAFESLGRYTATSVSQIPGICSNQAPQYSTQHVDISTFAQCATLLSGSADSKRCVIAKLPVRRQRAKAARLMAVSGQSQVDNRLAASRRLVHAIDKAYRGQKAPFKAIIEHDTLLRCTAQQTPTGAVERGERLILPVLLASQWLVILLERNSTKPFSVAEQSVLETLSQSHLARVMLADPDTLGLRAAVTRSLSSWRTRLFEYLPASICAVLMGVLMLCYLLYPVEHRISAPLSIEAAEQHVLIAPVDGFVESVSVSAGDQVRKGQVLATLDDKELQLQRQKLQSEGLQNQQAYARVLAAHDRFEVSRLKQEDALIRTELSRLNLQAEKMVLKAPVDGVVLSGSWEDFLGAAVSAGETLFSLGSDSSHRLVLNVSEYDVSHVQPNQPVAIRLAADPSTVLSGNVTAIMPLTVAEAGVNSVQVHARLDQDIQLRPGMQGIGKVLVGRQSRLMQWFQRAWARVIWLGWKLGVLR